MDNLFTGFFTVKKNISRYDYCYIYSLFRANLKNEIYYYDTGNFLTSFNTNIDKSHKYGLEVYDKFPSILYKIKVPEKYDTSSNDL